MKQKAEGIVTIAQEYFVAAHEVFRMPVRFLSLALPAVFLLTGCNNDVQPPVTSTLISNAMIHDGSGTDAYRGAVRIDFATQRILAVGDVEPVPGEFVYDADGFAVAPGFIDTHSHHDEDLEEHRDMPGVVSQGITTIVRGMDGSTAGYTSVADFNAAFAARPAAVNIASYSPHNTIRQLVMGADNRRHASDEELAAMAALLEDDLDAGALGLSTGLEYEPGIFSSTDELIVLAKVAAERSRRYSSHLRDEDDRFIEALGEIVRIGREAHLPVHVSHIKLADKLYWGTTDEVLGVMDAARADGVELTADIYPYERWASNLAVLFPDRDYGNRATAEYTFARTAAPEDILLIRYPPEPRFEGMTIAEIAAVTERDAVDTLLELSQAAADYRLETGEPGSEIIARSMNDTDIASFMKWPYINICSDGWHGGHPRGYGSFPRVLGRFVRDNRVISLEEAVYKMTGRAADTLGIADRGRLAVGHFADVVVFDPATVRDHATMTDPTAMSTGIRSVWVNGMLVFDAGETTHVYSGKIVTPGE